MRTVINGQDVYLDGDNIPEFSYSLNELTDFTKVKGSSSTTFDIPASNGARVGLGGVAMQEQPIGEVPIRIGEGGQVLFEGVCVPTEWTDESIKVVAYGDNATWFDRAKSTKCKDVDLGFTENITAQMKIDSWTDDTRADVYPLIDYGSMGAYTSATNVTQDKLYPAIKVHKLLEKFFNEQGYTISIKGSLNKLWKKLILPFAGGVPLRDKKCELILKETEPFNPFDPEELELIAEGNIAQPLFFRQIQSDECNQRASNSIGFGVFYGLLAGQDGDWEVYLDATFVVRRTAATINSGQELVFTLLSYDPTALTYNAISTFRKAIPTGQLETEVAVAEVVASATLELNQEVYLQVKAAPFQGGQPEVFAKVPRSITYRSKDNNRASQLSNSINSNLSVADIISSLSNIFRLAIQTDQLTNVVTFQHYDEFLLDISEGVDWTERLSHNQPPLKVRPEVPERFVFQYAEDEKDEAARDYNSQSQWTAEGIYETDGRDDENITTLKFAATQQAMRFFNGSVGVDASAMLVPVIKEEDKVTDYTKCKPRILVYDGLQPGVWRFNGVNRTEFPRAYFAGSGGNDINIGFGNDAGRLGTLERFWRASLIRAVKPYLKGEFRVYDDEFMNFEFARPRLVNDGYGNVWMYVQVVKGKKFGDDDLVDCELIPV
jgi:hypothetical protein